MLIYLNINLFMIDMVTESFTFFHFGANLNNLKFLAVKRYFWSLKNLVNTLNHFFSIFFFKLELADAIVIQ